MRKAVPAYALALLALASPALAGPISYAITVDTSSSFFTGVTGSLDFQFNPGDATSQAATATITNFLTDGTVGSVIPPTPPVTGGGASGSLPGTATIVNSALSPDSNELNQAFTYGSTFSFVLTFSGDALDNPTNNGLGSTFRLFLLDGSGNTLPPNMPNSPIGEVLDIDLNPDGTTTAFTFPFIDASGALQPAVATAVVIPEPSALGLLGLGLAGLWGCRRFSGCFRRRSHRAAITTTCKIT
jgi:hypothetical protein